MRKYILFTFVSLIIISGCKETQKESNNTPTTPSDLNFGQVDSIQGYSDLIFQALKTSRAKVVLEHMDKNLNIDESQFIQVAKAYSHAILKKSNWKEDRYEFKSVDGKKGFGYRFSDERRRTSVLIEIEPIENESKDYSVRSIKFASRIDALESIAFPGGPISESNTLLNSKN